MVSSDAIFFPSVRYDGPLTSNDFDVGSELSRGKQGTSAAGEF